MVRFRSSDRPTPRNYLSRREQWRLLVLVMSLGLVVILMSQIRRPESAAWLGWFVTGNPERGDQGSAAGERPAPPAEPTVRISPAEDERAASRFFPGVRPALFDAVRDDTYFRSVEQGAWFNLLSILQRTASSDLQSASIGKVGYARLVGQPQVYRGQLVTVRGTVRQVTVQHPAENDMGLESYYRLVIQPADGGLWPIFAYVLGLPVEIRPGEDLPVDVAITGFYFKNLSYQWRDGLGIAPVVLAKDVTVAGPAAAAAAMQKAARPPIAADLWAAEANADSAATGSTDDLSEVLSLAGWGADRLASFGDDTPPTGDQRQALVELLWRVRTFDAASIAAWTRTDESVESLVAGPGEHRGEMVRLAGQVRHVVRHALSAEDAARLEMPAYFEVELELEGGAVATVITASVPDVWLELGELDEPVSASGLFVKRLPVQTGADGLLFVSQRIAWHPTVAREPLVSFGASVLGTLSMDVGLLDDVHNHRRIEPSEREAFYQMLDAVGRVGGSQLIRFAQENLSAVREAWASEAERLAGQFDASADPAPPADAEQRLLLAEEVVRRAEEGRYSVALLFNDAAHQIGRLAVFDGVARRAVRIEVGTSPDGTPSDVFRRFGIDHYYEVEVFTDDSQNYPLVFCLRELPAGFPTGGAIHEPVRAAGFFFKSWLYGTRRTGSGEDGGSAAPAGLPQYAPLLIGRAPIWLEPNMAESRWPEIVGAGLFVLALAAVWGLAWWYARGDRQFDRTVLAAKYSLPEGQSLDELNLPDDKAGADD